eukprot:jgi/Botrbrau1/10000/Bobra.0012s0089.1
MRRIARALCRSLPQAQNLISSQEVVPLSNTPLRQFTAAPRLCSPTHIQDEPYCRQRQLLVLGNRVPALSQDVWLAPNAVIVGDVDLYDRVSVWYGCVLRGDLNNITVNSFSNIQDRSILHAARTSPTGLKAATTIGSYVTVGRGSLLRSTTVEDEVLLGDRCILLEGSYVETHSILTPGTVVPPGRLIPSGQLWGGVPARYIRDLTKDEIAEIGLVAQGVFKLADMHKEEFIPESFQYVDAERVKKALAEGTK